MGSSKECSMLVEGTNINPIICSEGVYIYKTSSNNVAENEIFLGIEAARLTIIIEIQYVLSHYSIKIDYRHLMLLADWMCNSGEVLGVTCFNITKMKNSALMLASFEKINVYLFNAAIYEKKDKVVGTSERIIIGIPILTGTGLFKLIQLRAKIFFSFNFIPILSY